ncbi:acetate kinase [Patescibacteria group bacterium]|nr:acetate kinase [Patescibacteria group bacterium]
MILILNCGSQSIKWKLFDKNLKLKKKGQPKNFRDLKTDLKNIDQNIDLIGHRFVHGGEKFRKPVEINKSTLRALKKLRSLALLHNPFNILGIKIASQVFPKVKQIVVFDTGFYKDLSDKVSIYPVPGNFKRFGFHGISHEYVGNKHPKKKIISVHLGGGASITAIKNGKPIDTSMGYTPMEGLMMMTRSGDIDPCIVIKLGRKAEHILNKESGIKAICGEVDMRDVLKRKDKKAKLALDMYVYRIQKYIGAYYAILGGCDLLIFTGAIGYGSARIRKMITKDLKIFDKTKILAIKPNEELAIAQKIKK